MSGTTIGGISLSSQLALFDTDTKILIPERHINYEVSDLSGLQDVGYVPGLKFWEEYLTPEEQAECVKQVDKAEDMWATGSKAAGATLRLAL